MRGLSKRDSHTKPFALVGFLLLLVLLLSLHRATAEGSKESKWAGVDEAVIERIAKEHGREVRDPLIGDNQGDIMLFLFLMAGAAGGFAAGYYWRVLIAERRQKEEMKAAAGSPDARMTAEKRE